MVIRPPLLDFSAGELSPKLAGRIDSPVYYKGCQRLTNFFPRITGGMGKRPGFVWVGESLGPGRLIPWTLDPRPFVSRRTGWQMPKARHRR